MRDASLQFLDIIENAIRSGATTIGATLEGDRDHDCLRVVVEDDGSGLHELPEVAVDPSCIGREGFRTSAGLGLFRHFIAREGGGLSIDHSELGGLAITITLRMADVDRSLIGKLIGSLASVVGTNPGLELWCRLRARDDERTIRASMVAGTLPPEPCRGVTVGRAFQEQLVCQLESLELVW